MRDEILIAILTFNEQDRISDVLEEVSKSFKNILVVDNNSTDNTVENVNSYPVSLVKHRYNLGKSDSMKTALEFAKINNFEYVAYMDGDGQHKVQDLINISEKIVNNKSDLVIGYRKELNNLNLQKKIGTIILQNLFSFIYKKKIYDIQSGLRIIKLSIEDKIYWKSTGSKHYFADAEITCNAVKNKCIIDQVPIETHASEKYKGMHILQGIYLCLMIIIWRFF